MSTLPHQRPNESPDRRNEERAQSPPNSSSPTMTSEDSDTVLLDDPVSHKPQPEQPSAAPRPPPPSRQSTLGVKKCWICICDSTEDDPLDPPIWRSPCSCSLTAHEECLLDWVADLENPKNRKRHGPPTKIQCPQCKSEIKIARPRNYVVEAVRVVDRVLGRFVYPGLGLSFFGTIYAGAWVQGFYSVYLIFGRAQAEDIFRRALLRRAFLPGYALVPFNLIAARTNYADFVLPSGTLFLLATQLEQEFRIDYTIWPPLPSTVFACLPAFRTAYTWCYDKAFGDLNKRWLEEVQPRQNERFEGQADNVADRANAEEEAGEGGNVVLELEINIGAEVEEEVPAENADGGQAQAGDGDNGAGNAAANQILGPRGDELLEGTSSFGQSMLGALAFPAVAAGMGELLSFALPATWMTDANWMSGRPGLLRNKWGRSVVGGCLFVVLKDALLLYCRWKLAQSHRKRRIVDYDKKTKQYKMTS